MPGMEVVASLEIGGVQVAVYGYYGEGTPQGHYECFDVYVLNEDAGLQELVDVGEPFRRRPTRDELERLVGEVSAPSNVRRLDEQRSAIG